MDTDEFFDDVFGSHMNIQPGADSPSDRELMPSLGFIFPAEISLDDYSETNYGDVIAVGSLGDEPTRCAASNPSPVQITSCNNSGLELLAVKIPPDHVVQPDIASWRSSRVTVELGSSPPAKRRQQSRVRLCRKRRSDYGYDSRRLSVGSQPCLQPFSISRREEHILRERKRRDEMAERFLLLEKVLSPQPRRQKLVIVEDTIKLVKSLQRRRNELLRRRAQLQDRNINTVISCGSNKGSFSPSHTTKEPELMMPRPGAKKLGSIDAFQGGGCRGDGDADADDDELFQIHAQVSADEVFVEMMFCQGSPNLHARVMQTVESAKLEVVRASMQRSAAPSCGFIEFVIAAKSPVELCPSHHQDIQSSGRLLVGALQAAFKH